MDCLKDYYGMLGLKFGAPEDDVKAAYRAEVTRVHPDKPENRTPANEARFVEINEAFAALGDAEKKQRYISERLRSLLERALQRTARRDAPTPEQLRNQAIFHGALGLATIYMGRRK